MNLFLTIYKKYWHNRWWLRGILVSLIVLLLILYILIKLSSSPTNTLRAITYTKNIQKSERLAAWIYPDGKNCTALSELNDGRKITTVKIEWLTIAAGQLEIITTDDACLGFAPELIPALKQNTTEQYLTISALGAENIQSFLRNTDPNLTDFDLALQWLETYDLSGLELDFESFGDWNEELYLDYQNLVTILGNELHSRNKKLLVTAPAIWDELSQSWFVWHYADWQNLPVDELVIMTYDHQYDYGAGVAIAPLEWMQSVVKYVTTNLASDRLTFGIPSYAYTGTRGEYDIQILDYSAVKRLPGFNDAIRDPASAEMTWVKDGQVFFYNDTTSLDIKKKLLRDLGVESISVWHLGGNQWFTEEK